MKRRLNWNRVRYAEFDLRSGAKTVVEIRSRNLLSLTDDIPKEAYLFVFFDIFIATIRVEDRDVLLKSDREDISPKYFYGGTVYGLDEMKLEDPKWHHVMLSTGYTRMVKNRFGEFRPFVDGDRLIEIKNE